MENKNTNNDLLNELIVDINFKISQILDQKDEDILLNISQDIISDLINENDFLINNSSFDKRTNFLKKGLNSILFFTKYVLTSTFIFVFLLSVTNYSAYIEIAKSYFNSELLEQNRESMMASINSTSINVGNKNQPEEQKEKNELSIQLEQRKNIELVKNKTFHSMDKLLGENKDNLSNINIEITPYENRIVIPKINKNIPLVEVSNKKVNNIGELDKVFMQELENGIIRYPGTAKPGEVGNSFIFGHSSNFPWSKGDYNDVFALLDNVVFGDEIIAYYNQKKYIYKVKEKKIVKPGNISVLKRDEGKKELSLMTCWPVGTTLNRMIIIGELVEIK